MSHERSVYILSDEEMGLVYPDREAYYPSDRPRPEDRLPADPELKTPKDDALRTNTDLAELVAEIIAKEEAVQQPEIKETIPAPVTQEIGGKSLLLAAASL
jgi:hypothetical protein